MYIEKKKLFPGKERRGGGPSYATEFQLLENSLRKKNLSDRERTSYLRVDQEGGGRGCDKTGYCGEQSQNSTHQTNMAHWYTHGFCAFPTKRCTGQTFQDGRTEEFEAEGIFFMLFLVHC